MKNNSIDGTWSSTSSAHSTDSSSVTDLRSDAVDATGAGAVAPANQKPEGLREPFEPPRKHTVRAFLVSICILAYTMCQVQGFTAWIVNEGLLCNKAKTRIRKCKGDKIPNAACSPDDVSSCADAQDIDDLVQRCEIKSTTYPASSPTYEMVNMSAFTLKFETPAEDDCMSLTTNELDVEDNELYNLVFGCIEKAEEYVEQTCENYTAGMELSCLWCLILHGAVQVFLYMKDCQIIFAVLSMEIIPFVIAVIDRERVWDDVDGESASGITCSYYFFFGYLMEFAVCRAVFLAFPMLRRAVLRAISSILTLEVQNWIYSIYSGTIIYISIDMAGCSFFRVSKELAFPVDFDWGFEFGKPESLPLMTLFFSLVIAEGMLEYSCCIFSCCKKCCAKAQKCCAECKSWCKDLFEVCCVNCRPWLCTHVTNERREVRRRLARKAEEKQKEEIEKLEKLEKKEIEKQVKEQEDYLAKIKDESKKAGIPLEKKVLAPLEKKLRKLKDLLRERPFCNDTCGLIDKSGLPIHFWLLVVSMALSGILTLLEKWGKLTSTLEMSFFGATTILDHETYRNSIGFVNYHKLGSTPECLRVWNRNTGYRISMHFCGQIVATFLCEYPSTFLFAYLFLEQNNKIEESLDSYGLDQPYRALNLSEMNFPGDWPWGIRKCMRKIQKDDDSPWRYQGFRNAKDEYKVRSTSKIRPIVDLKYKQNIAIYKEQNKIADVEKRIKVEKNKEEEKKGDPRAAYHQPQGAPGTLLEALELHLAELKTALKEKKKSQEKLLESRKKALKENREWEHDDGSDLTEDQRIDEVYTKLWIGERREYETERFKNRATEVADEVIFSTFLGMFMNIFVGGVGVTCSESEQRMVPCSWQGWKYAGRGRVANNLGMRIYLTFLCIFTIPYCLLVMKLFPSVFVIASLFCLGFDLGVGSLKLDSSQIQVESKKGVRTVHRCGSFVLIMLGFLQFPMYFTFVLVIMFHLLFYTLLNKKCFDGAWGTTVMTSGKKTGQKKGNVVQVEELEKENGGAEKLYWRQKRVLRVTENEPTENEPLP